LPIRRGGKIRSIGLIRGPFERSSMDRKLRATCVAPPDATIFSFYLDTISKIH